MITKELVKEAFNQADESPNMEPESWGEAEEIEWEQIALMLHERMQENPGEYMVLGGIKYLAGMVAGIRIGVLAARKEALEVKL